MVKMQVVQKFEGLNFQIYSSPITERRIPAVTITQLSLPAHSELRHIVQSL